MLLTLRTSRTVTFLLLGILDLNGECPSRCAGLAIPYPASSDPPYTGPVPAEEVTLEEEVQHIADELDEQLDSNLARIAKEAATAAPLHSIDTECCGTLSLSDSDLEDLLALKPPPECFKSPNGQKAYPAQKRPKFPPPQDVSLGILKLLAQNRTCGILTRSCALTENGLTFLKRCADDSLD
eukprot:scaffold2639_cov385-Prasinococcus_capsulatus_cf.AAC.17